MSTVIELRDELNKVIEEGHGDCEVWHTDALSTPQVFQGTNVYTGSIWTDEETEISYQSEDDDDAELTEVPNVVVIEAI